MTDSSNQEFDLGDIADVKANAPAGSKYVSAVKYANKEVVSEHYSDEQVLIPDFQGNPVARVTVEASMTKNLGNYESAKITVGISLPCFPTQDQIKFAYDNVSQMVEEAIGAQLAGLN